MASASGFRKNTKSCSWIELTANAAVAYRPLDECADFVLGVVEQELIARTCRDVGERGERIAGRLVGVTRSSFCRERS
jgi:hypothetical protein